MAACPYCDGSGKIYCDSCGGSGKQIVNKQSVFYDELWETCVQCRGDAVGPCPFCGGSGQVAGKT